MTRLSHGDSFDAGFSFHQVSHSVSFNFSPCMSIHNKLITGQGGSHTARDGGGSLMISDGLPRLSTSESVLIYELLV